MDAVYSPDVELDHAGKVVASRDLKVGEIIPIPAHMLPQLRRQKLSLKKP